MQPLRLPITLYLTRVDVEMTIQFVLYAIAFIIIGLALDAAFYWRFSNLLGAFYNTPKELTYKSFVFPRLFFIAITSLVVAFGSFKEPPNAVVIIVGGIFFLAASFYPHIIIYLKSSR